MADPFLTIGIPTYNRADAVSARVSELLEGGLPDDVEILVIDNASTDGTAELLRTTFSAGSIRVLSNATNLGYGGNFFRLFAEARSEYLLVVSDEDRVELGALRELIRFCRDRRPGFVSPRAHVHGNPSYRGSARTRPVSPTEFKNASFYVSGLTFALDRAVADTRELEPQLGTNSAVSIYPQVLLAALATARGDATYLDQIVTTHMEHRPTNITELTGGIYNRVTGRWTQALGFESFFEERLASADPAVAPRYRAMRDRVRGELFDVLMVAMRRENPELAAAVRRSTSVRRRVERVVTHYLPKRLSGGGGGS
jgi:glycosyltransferase involved in cell wall biosynthesis